MLERNIFFLSCANYSAEVRQYFSNLKEAHLWISKCTKLSFLRCCNCAKENDGLSSSIIRQLGKTLCSTPSGRAVRVSNQTDAIICPLITQICFLSSCQLLRVRPPRVDCISLLCRVLIHVPALHRRLSTSLAKQCGRRTYMVHGLEADIGCSAAIIRPQGNLHNLHVHSVYSDHIP